MLRIYYYEIWQKSIFDHEVAKFNKVVDVMELTNIKQGELLTFKKTSLNI